MNPKNILVIADIFILWHLNATLSLILKITEIRKQEETKLLYICKIFPWGTTLRDLHSEKISRNTDNWVSSTDRMVKETVFNAYEKVSEKKKLVVENIHAGLKEYHFD